MTTIDTPPSTARLLLARGDASLARHLDVHGPLRFAATPEGREALFREIELSGLTGRGGGGFPSYRKLRSITASGGRPYLVVNAMEGEPASAKDAALLRTSPHLLLDGIELVADAIGAARTILCIPDDRASTREQLHVAIGERRVPAGLPTVEILTLPARYVTGEESALVAAAAGGAGLPRHRLDKSTPLAIGRHPTLVHNVETLSNIALIARHGAAWFSSVGTPDAPGTALVTVSGDVEEPRVLEVAIGMQIDRMVEEASPRGVPQAALVGGYGGVWLGRSELDTAYAPEGLRPFGASMGAGVLLVLTANSCGIRGPARIVRFMAAESAGQCGPCLFGLPALADDLRRIADADADAAVLDRLVRRCHEVDGRGACRHPDGVVRLVWSSLRVFADDVAAHLRGQPCAGSTRSSVLPFSTQER